MIKHVTDDPSVWIWSPKTCNAFIASAVYNCINSSTPNTEIWKDWQDIWRLPVLSRVKLFLWKLAHGRLSTSDYFYQLNIGPPVPYVDCLKKLLCVSFGIVTNYFVLGRLFFQ